MIIEEIMKKNVATLEDSATIAEAIEVLAKHRIRHIPVVNKEVEVIGIISDRDIRDASPSIFHSEEHIEDFQKPISEIMKKNVITAHPLDFVEEVASIFYDHHIGCLPIEEDGKLVGIITETQVLHKLVELMGAHQPSSQIEVKVENITGMLAEIAAIFKRKKVNITSVLVYPSQDEKFKILVFRVQTMDPRSIISEIEGEGYEVLWPNMPGVNL
ncbi:acetoin utilization AcuB family protein [Bacillus alkalicellulosilyticus]|uniref:acetoin utilization AcuB family protein n=1 Tax=Alkalihalobacterium alkalicellulosilyticum TaxID=1912214 RepID=UPI000996911E|nr:acetoin utilization AcuB family protein [Bacillus alkalicellulosilyticus]